MLPLARPAIAVLTVFTFISFWGSFLWPLIIVNSVEDKGTVPLEYEHQIQLDIEKDGRLDGFCVWLNLCTADDEWIDILANEHCWLPVWLPAFDPGIQVKRGDRIEGSVICTLAENGLNPDFIVRGKLIQPGAWHRRIGPTLIKRAAGLGRRGLVLQVRRDRLDRPAVPAATGPAGKAVVHLKHRPAVGADELDHSFPIFDLQFSILTQLQIANCTSQIPYFHM